MRVTALDSHVKIAVKINIKQQKPKSLMFLKPPRASQETSYVSGAHQPEEPKAQPFVALLLVCSVSPEILSLFDFF